jgi:predicted nucleotidyltransferase
MLSTPQKVIILKILEPFDPARIGVFGTYTRNEAKEESDIDILVHFNKRITLLDLIGMEQELSEGLKKRWT